MSGYVATWSSRMSGSSFFLLLSAISLLTGAAMIVLYRPLQKAVGDENEAGHLGSTESPQPIG
jgi:hypothetical protein